MKTTGRIVGILLAICLLSGCQTFDEDQAVYSTYYQTTLGLSTSADVLDQLTNPLDEYLSQSESVVASWNETNEGQTH